MSADEEEYVTPPSPWNFDRGCRTLRVAGGRLYRLREEEGRVVFVPEFFAGTCSDCRFWAKGNSCRRFAPLLDGWPSTLADDGCAEGAPRETP